VAGGNGGYIVAVAGENGSWRNRSNGASIRQKRMKIEASGESLEAKTKLSGGK